MVDVVPQGGELHHLGLEGGDLLLAEPHDLPPQADVLAAREVAVEARLELEQGADPAVDDDLSLGGKRNAGDHLEDGGLARAVCAEERHALALADGEAQVAAGMDVLVAHLLREHAEQALAIARVELVALRNVLELDDNGPVLDGDGLFGRSGRRFPASREKLGQRLLGCVCCVVRQTCSLGLCAAWAAWTASPAGRLTV